MVIPAKVSLNKRNQSKILTYELTSTRTHCTNPQMAANPTIITANLLSIFMKTILFSLNINYLNNN